jgi:hypothetical protein
MLTSRSNSSALQDTYGAPSELQEKWDRRTGRLTDYEPQRADTVSQFFDREAGSVLASVRDPGEQRRDVPGRELSGVAQFPQRTPETPFNRLPTHCHLSWCSRWPCRRTIRVPGWAIGVKPSFFR